MAKRIVVIDDDEAILDATTLALESEGYIVDHYSSPDDFFSEESNFPHLILLDMILNRVDGRDVVKKIKSQERTKHIPVVMLSAHPSVRDSILASGADDFLPKPFDIEELYAVIEKYT